MVLSGRNMYRYKIQFEKGIDQSELFAHAEKGVFEL